MHIPTDDVYRVAYGPKDQNQNEEFFMYHNRDRNPLRAHTIGQDELNCQFIENVDADDYDMMEDITLIGTGFCQM
ncbi:hypothetical protein ACOME3_005208 [Neoechinorhynchus agilis]